MNEQVLKRSKKLIVIGGGIAGLSTAIYMARDGFDVVCIESHAEEALETSAMNGSLFCPSLTLPWCNVGNIKNCLFELLNAPFSSTDQQSISFVLKYLMFDVHFWRWLSHFTVNSLDKIRFLDLYRSSHSLSLVSLSCLDELRLATSGFSKGTLQLFSSSSSRDVQYSIIQRVVADITLVESREFSVLTSNTLDPHLSPGGGLLSRLDTSYDISNLCKELRQTAESEGVQFIFGKSVIGFHVDQSSSSVISRVNIEGGESIPVDMVVVAAGNHSNDFALWAGDGVHSWPVRGYAAEVPISAESKVLDFNVVDDVNRVYIAPLPGRVVRLSGFCEFGSRTPHTSPTSAVVTRFLQHLPPYTTLEKHSTGGRNMDFDRAWTIVDQAHKLLPVNYLANKNCPTIKLHTCWRPQTPDDLPVIGRSSRISNMYYNAGHGHLGLTRAVGSAKILTHIVSGRQEKLRELGLEPEDFAPARFAAFPSITRVIKALFV
jgi:D-amino-acid dehydrogenase